MEYISKIRAKLGYAEFVKLGQHEYDKIVETMRLSETESPSSVDIFIKKVVSLSKVHGIIKGESPQYPYGDKYTIQEVKINGQGYTQYGLEHDLCAFTDLDFETMYKKFDLLVNKIGPDVVEIVRIGVHKHKLRIVCETTKKPDLHNMDFGNFLKSLIEVCDQIDLCLKNGLLRYVDLPEAIVVDKTDRIKLVVLPISITTNTVSTMHEIHGTIPNVGCFISDFLDGPCNGMPANLSQIMKDLRDKCVGYENRGLHTDDTDFIFIKKFAEDILSSYLSEGGD
jgi:hypothetical protein